MKIYNKLVRDKIPEIIACDNGKTCATRIMEDALYIFTKINELFVEIGE